VRWRKEFIDNALSQVFPREGRVRLSLRSVRRFD